MGGDVNGLLDIYRSLFSGNTTFYGQHQYKPAAEKGQKAEGNSWTEDKQLTEKQYQQHLDGNRGLGVCPLRQDNTCAFGAIDVDIYDNDAFCFTIIKAIYKWKLPILPFRTKSGGLHLYIFFKSDQSSLKYPTGSETIRLLMQIVNMLSLKDYEIFPKQSVIHKDKKGNWINLPYFNLDKSRQYLISDKNKQVPFVDAIELIQSCQQTITDIEQGFDSLPFSDGPPCLQRITLKGGPEAGHGRNVFLFNSALYFKEKDHTSFDVMLDELNDGIDDPLSASELTQIKKSSIKQEYNYACHTSPLCDHCDKDKCSTKKFGVGKSGGLFMGIILGQMTIKKGKGTIYAWEVTKDNRKGTISFDSPRDLINQDNFIAAVLNVLRYKVTKIKAEKYDRMLNSALEGAIEVDLDIADDNTLEGRVAKSIVKYLTTSLTNSVTDLERGMAYLWEERKSILFIADDAWKYIVETNKMRTVRNTDFQEVMRKLNIGHAQKKVNGKNKRVRIIDLDHLESIVGGPIKPLDDIDFEEEAKRDEDY